MGPTLAPRAAACARGSGMTPRSIRCPGCAAAGTLRAWAPRHRRHRYFLPDGRPLLDDVTVPRRDGRTASHWVGPNGAARRRCCGSWADEDAARRLHRAQRRAWHHAPGHRPDRRRPVHPGPAGLARRPGAPDAAVELASAELAIMEVDDEPAQMRYAQALATGRTSAVRGRAGWDRVPMRAVHPVRRGPSTARCAPCPAASRSGSSWRRSCGGPDEVLLARRAGQRPRRADQALARGPAAGVEQDRPVRDHDREMLARVATQVATLEPGVNGRPCGCTAAASRPTTRRARTGARGSRSCWRRWEESTPSSRTSCSPCAPRRRSTTGSRPGTRPPRRACASSRGWTADAAGPRAERQGATARAAAPPSARWSRPVSSSPV